MADSRITEVSVYKSGAIVKRLGSVHLEKGSQTVKLMGLKAAVGQEIASDSVKLAVDERVSCTNVQVETMPLKDIEDTLKPISEKITAKEAELEVINLQESMWKANSDFTNKESVSIDSMVSYIDSLEGRLNGLNEKKAALEKELEVLRRDYKEHKDYLMEPYVKADLCCEEAGDYSFRISYYCDSIYWEPFYEVHTDDEKDNIEIRLRAKVRQYTSEDWQGVKLNLYAMDPTLSGTIPTLNPSYLSFYSPAPRMFAGGGMMMAARTAVSDEAVAMEDAAPMMGMGNFAEVKTKGASFKTNNSILEYELEGTWDIPKEKEIICDLSSKNVNCRYHDICVPKLDTRAFLAAEVKTSDVEELMDTEAAIYIKGTYMGDAYLSIDLSKDNYDISLGVDETLKVARKQERRYTSNVLLKGQKKTELVYEISASSKKDRKCELLLMDQVPVSNEKSIEVGDINISGGEYQEDTGRVSWTINLEPGETVKKTLGYSVAYPKDKTINNL